ncbi:MAG: DUF2130 domain-containing protein [Clostridia bacterium]|nr:DUF2130 domain-containing protein [Clostridia bacterium]
MQQIKCPHCGELFQIDESGYAQIVQQVRDQTFEEELARREKLLIDRQQSAMEVMRVKQAQAQEQLLARKDGELADKDRIIERLQTRLDGSDVEKKLAVSEAVQQKERQLAEKDNEIVRLQGKLSVRENEALLREKALQEQYQTQLQAKEEQIRYYKDFRARMSTKLVGESLEQHCLIQFNALRMTAFPTAYFEKDNDARTGSKGDFIFRESLDGTEFISIMFEMKNEQQETAAKHKNEDFFKELDKDRREKNCEYAVLVSMLEADNELYNNGIVDVSYKYPKMYVVRPQCFIPIITLLRNAALNTLQFRRELERMRSQQVDLQQFEQNMEAFKTAFSKNYQDASNRFNEAVAQIDKTIEAMQKIKENLLKSGEHLRRANAKAEDLSIKQLTKNAPSLQQKFAALAQGDT